MMKIKKLDIVVCTFSIFLGAMTIAVKPGLTQENRFFCGQGEYEGKVVPATISRTERGNEIPVIYWVSGYYSSSSETPMDYCDAVSQKFQQYFDNDLLRYIRTGEFNQSGVICVARQTGEECDESDILITLPPDVDRFEALGILLDLRRRAAGRPLYLTNQLIMYRNQEAYINIEIFIERLVVE
ncbi:MAG: COP23 domain-containing protein [Cyanobacteria bacterium P01_F01_bin.53]